jgi:tRNA(Ile)-lysidine synthetase-like protein
LIPVSSSNALTLSHLPSGPWAVGVSGGADSIALLSLLRAHPNVRPHVVHLDHQLRGEASAADARFGRDLAARWGVPSTVVTRASLEPRLGDLPANPSARYRALRLALFREVVGTHKLAGVLLAHHADDQAETVLARLLRGSGYAGLCGMAERTNLAGLVILRPLLQVRREALRQHLTAESQPWREDASNASDRYQRNRLRRLLRDHPSLTEDLLRLADACRSLRNWVRRASPTLDATFPADRLRNLPSILAKESARTWLIARGVPAGELDRSPAAVDRLLEMSRDSASPARLHFPGRILVTRKAGVLSSSPPGIG